jgi:hypothetical protein
VLLVVEPNLFVIDTIILPELEALAMMSDTKINIDTKTSTNVEISTNAKIGNNAKPIMMPKSVLI